MRHVTGLFLALVMAVVLYAGAGWGAHRIDALRAAGTHLSTRPGLLALAALAGTGLLLGILLVVPRVSPLAAVLPGLGLLAWSAYMAVNAAGADRLIPMRAAAIGLGFRSLLADGVLALIGAVMIIPLFVPSRWRRSRPAADDDGYGDGFGRPSPTGLLR
jgi:hypothetical protein